MRPFRALSFDLDGTLLDGSRFHESIVRTCERIAATEPGLSTAQLVEANDTVWRSLWPEAEDKWKLGTLDSRSLALEAWRLTLAACGYNDETMVRLALETHPQLERESYRLFDDAQELLTSLQKQRVPLALITNGASDTQRDKLRVLDLEQIFDAVVISAEVGIAKPDPACFAIALDRLAVDPRDMWHVGDDLVTDVAGAKTVGLTSIWLNRDGHTRAPEDPQPDTEISSLSNLLTFRQ